MKNTIKEVVAARFKAIREELGVNQTQFAIDLGYQTQSAYSKLELGKNAPSIIAYEEIAKKYKVRQSWLAFGSGEKFMTDEEHEKFMEQYKEEDDADDIFKKITPSVNGIVKPEKAILLKTVELLEAQIAVLRQQIENM